MCNPPEDYVMKRLTRTVVQYKHTGCSLSSTRCPSNLICVTVSVRVEVWGGALILPLTVALDCLSHLLWKCAHTKKKYTRWECSMSFHCQTFRYILSISAVFLLKLWQKRWAYSGGKCYRRILEYCFGVNERMWTWELGWSRATALEIILKMQKCTSFVYSVVKLVQIM